MFYFFSSLHTEKRKANLLDQLTNTSGTIIGVTSCIVIILIVISVIVQIKQPRKKFVQRKTDFDQTVFQEVFEPPHYELCTLRGTGTTADLADVADDFENYHKLRRSSSKCIHDHHCGSQLSSTKGSRSNLSTRDASVLTEIQPQPVKPLIQPVNRRNILVMKHSYSQDAADACEIDEIEEVPTTSHRLSRHDKAVQRSVSIDFWWRLLCKDLIAQTYSLFFFFSSKGIFFYFSVYCLNFCFLTAHAICYHSLSLISAPVSWRLLHLSFSFKSNIFLSLFYLHAHMRAHTSQQRTGTFF